MPLRGIRGATCLTADDAAEMSEAVGELLTAMMERNSITTEHRARVHLPGPPDLPGAAPAAGPGPHRGLDVPLLSASEMNVTGALERVVRVLMHVDVDVPRSSISHVYLRGAEQLRQDLVQ